MLFMEKKTVSAMMLTLLLTSMLTLAFNIQPVKATGTIYNRADGSVDLASEIRQRGRPGIIPSPEVLQYYRDLGQDPPKVSDWPAELSESPVIGTRNTLVIMTDFPDQAGVQTQTHYQNLLFGGTQGTMSHYYAEVSYGLLTVTGSIAGTGWYRSAHNMVWWGADSANDTDDANADIFELAREAVTLAAANINFKTYDTNNNNTIEPNELSICIVHAGNGQEASNNPTDIWSHRWYIFGQGYTFRGINLTDTIVDGCRISHHPDDDVGGYFMQAENSPMGTFAHEFGHDLGLPDLYNTTRGGGSVVGNWSLMAHGNWLDNGTTPAHLDPWSKIQLGWLSPIVVEHYLVTTVDQTESNSGNRVYRLDIHGTQQYFLIENREKTGYDSYLPEAGVLIWHIDEAMQNNSRLPPRVALEQPGGSLDTAAYSSNDGQTTFDSTTAPNSNANDGTTTSISVWGIGADGSSMKVAFFRAFAYVHCSWGMSTMQDEMSYLNSLDPDKYSFDWYDETNIEVLWSNLGEYQALLIDEDTFYSDSSWTAYGGPIYNSFKAHASELASFVENGSGIFTSGENDLGRVQTWDWLPLGMQVTSYDPEMTSSVHIVYDPGLYSNTNVITNAYLSGGHTHAWFVGWDQGYTVTVRRDDNNQPIELFGVFGKGVIVVSHIEAEDMYAWGYIQNQLNYTNPAYPWETIITGPIERKPFFEGQTVTIRASLIDATTGNPGTNATVTANSPNGTLLTLVETPPGTGIYMTKYTILETDPIGNWTINVVGIIGGKFPKSSVTVRIVGLGMPIRLTFNAATDWFPIISGDGRKIVFDSDVMGNSEIFIMNSDGSGVKQLTSNMGWSWVFSLDNEGNRVVFTSNVTGNLEIYIVVLARHDIVLTNIAVSKTVIAQGYSVSTNITITNQGNFTETFNVTLYANTTVIGYWSFDEGSGTTAYDSSGNGNNGAIYGATWDNGAYGKALSFDGVDDYVSVPDSDLWHFGVNDFSIGFLVYFNSLTMNKHQLMGQSNGGNIQDKWFIAFNFSQNPNCLTFDVCRTGGTIVHQISFPWTPSTDMWYYTTIVRSGTGWYLYVNGVQEGPTQTSNIDIPNVASTLKIGSDGELWNFHDGLMDEVRIFNRSLSAEEVWAEYTRTCASVTLESGASTTITFTWNTSGFAYGNYTISAVADTVPGETDTADNTFVDGLIKVSCLGDLNGDYITDGQDYQLVKKAVPSSPGSPKWNPNADLNDDHIVDGQDFQTVKNNIGQSAP